MSNIPSLLEMLKAGAHFGHQHSRWHPKMGPYIYGSRNGVHVINLERTQEDLTKALEYVKNLASKGKIILFVGTKRQAQAPVKAAAESCGMPFLTERWIGGLLTNFSEAKDRLKKYRNLKDQVATGEIEKYTKKEQVELKKKLAKMDKYLNGLVNMDRMPDALYVADMREAKTAVAEANRVNVPIVGVCDTNVNPDKAAYVIPANDDAVNSIKMIVDLIAEAIKEGKAEWEKNKVPEVKKVEAPQTERRAIRKEESI
jgi:small subunit ribosomal protein S2